MLKFLLCILFSTASGIAMAQTDSLSKEERRLLDSMFNNDEFIKLMAKKPKNYVDVGIGFGNGEFSSHNNAANATGVNQKLVYTPGVTSRLKNGLNFAITGFLASVESGNLQLYQTGLTGGYEYSGKSFDGGVSYTRYLSNQNKYNSNSLYQNDFYGYIKRSTGLLQPGLALGYANGSYKEAYFVSFKRTIHLNNPPPNGRDTVIVISGIDSTNNKASYFSASVSLGHDFSFYRLFNPDDELDFTPSLIVNAGSDKLTQEHTNRLFNRPIFTKRKKSDFSNKFQLQSVAASVSLTYMVKKFFLQPEVYLDYYLPQTTGNRLSAVFLVKTGFTF